MDDQDESPEAREHNSALSASHFGSLGTNKVKDLCRFAGCAAGSSK